MWKIFFFLCALAITSKCNGDRSDAVEMKSFMVKPMNTQQLQALMSLRNSHPQYYFQGGPMRINRSHLIIYPRDMENSFLDKMTMNGLNDQNDGRKNNFIVKQRFSDDDDSCTLQLGDACLEDSQCCEGSCKPLFPSSRSCQN